MVKFRYLIVAFVALALAAVLMAPSAQAANWKKKCDNIIILYDTSGSMAEAYKDTGKSRFALAEQLMEDMVAEIPDLDYKVGLYSFTPFKAYYPLQPFNKNAFISAVDSLPDDVPGGFLGGSGTPLGKAMKDLGKVLEGTSGKTVIYLVTDGKNTDDMNPYRAAKKVAEDHDVCFYIISLSPWKDGNKIMRKISALGRPCTKLYQIEKVLGNPKALIYPVAEAVEPEARPVLIEEEVVVVEEVTPVVEFVEITFFDFDKTAIKPGAKEALDEVGAFMKENLEEVAVISGFTDSTGSADYNMGLSKRRAEAVRDFLVDNYGIDTERFVLHWYGMNDPIAPNNTSQGRAKNRRAELVMIGAR